MKNHFKILGVFLAVLTSSACSTSNGRYEALSTRPLSLYDIQNHANIITKKAEAVSTRHAFVLIPTGKAPTLGAAVNQILNEYNGDYLINVDVKRVSMQLMFWYQYNSWQIEADVVKINH